MSSLTKITNRKKDIFILGKCPTRRLEHALSAEKYIQLTLLNEIRSFA